LQSIGFWGLGKRLSCAKTGGQILTIYTSYDVFLSKAEQGMGRWVMGQMGHENRMGHMGHGSLGVDP